MAGLPGTLSTAAQLCSLFALSIPHRAFLVEFFLTCFQERFVASHPNAALDTLALHLQPPGLSSPQLHSHEMRPSGAASWAFPLLLLGGLRLGLGKAPQVVKGTEDPGSWLRGPQILKVGVGRAWLWEQEPRVSSCLPGGA